MSSIVAGISWMSFTQKHYNETIILVINKNAGRNKDFGHIFDRFYILTFQGGALFVDHLCYFCPVFIMFSCASVD